VDADEDPAYAIIRKAIKNKNLNREGLLNFHYNFYSKNILRSGRDIVFIEEDVGEGVKVLPDSVEEIKTKFSKTKNLSDTNFQNSDLIFFEKKIIDFSEDSLTLGKFVFHLPISTFAFDYYDYKLLSTQQSDDLVYYEIEVIPRSKIRPTFMGEILIADSSYALAGLNLKLENRNLIPFMEFKMSIIQNLIKHKNFWLPKYYNIDVETYMNFYHLISLDSAITSYVKVFNNYTVNVSNDDSLLQNLNRINDTTFTITSIDIAKEEMDSIRLYPLQLSETEAYEEIDSTKDIVSSLQLGGVGGEYIKSHSQEENDNDSGNGIDVGAVFKYLYLQNNRVDGLLLGLKYSSWGSDNSFNFSGATGYSLSRKDIESTVQTHFPVKKSLISSVELDANYGTMPFNSITPYSELLNAVSVTLGFEDQYNYFFSRGISIAAKKNFKHDSNIKFGIKVESQGSVKENKYYSIFNSKRSLRENPEIIEGMDNRAFLKLNLGSSPYNLGFQTNDGISSLVEFSSKIVGSDFNYTKINLTGQFFIRTFFDELFFSPYLAIYVDINSVFGNYGPQHLTSPQTAMGVFSPLGTFKGILPYQFIGNNSVSLHLEHNWRKTFFEMLGIYFPIAWNLELTTGVNGLKTWNNSDYLTNINSNDYYWEVYGGISGILGILNINLAYNKFKNTVVRLGFSKFF